MHLALVDLAVIFLVSVVAAVLCHRLNVPTAIGMLVGGVLIGPDVLGLVHHVDTIEAVAEIGVVLLLFIIGLEFSIADLRYLRRQFLVGGTWQFFGTAAVVGVASLFMGFSAAQSLFVGFVVALSSTAVVIKMLQDRGELQSPHGRVTFATLIFQDIAVVPVMLLGPLLAVAGGAAAVAGGSVGGGGGVATEALWLVAKIAGVGALSWVAYRWVVPFVLDMVTRTRSQEAFLLTIVMLCVGIAQLTQALGLSLALGAFLAGLIISESDYSHQAMALMMPLRDIFMALFFVSIGLLLDVQFLLAHPIQIALFTLGIIAIKPFVGTVAALVVGLPISGAVLSGLLLGQVGEFSFVATRAGIDAGLLPPETFQIILTTAVLSMLLTPALGALGPWLIRLIDRSPLECWEHRRFNAAAVRGEQQFSDHVVIAGFGITGRAVAHAAREADVPYAVLEVDALIVRNQLERGEPITYGDAALEPIALQAGVDKARAIVVTISNLVSARQATELARRLNPNAYILVRTRNPREVPTLKALGATEVIADELEVSVEALSRTLVHLGVGEAVIAELSAEVRDAVRAANQPRAEVL